MDKAKQALKRRTSQAGTLYLVHVLTHSTRARLDGILSALGLSSFHYTILSVIGHHDGVSSARLSRRFHVTPQAMGEVILLLERRGLVARVEDVGNRKVLRLSLTEAALEIIHQADRIVAEFEKALFAGRTPAELETFREFLTSTLTTVRDQA